MDRRRFLKTTAAGAVGALAAGRSVAPAVSQRTTTRTLRFMPYAGLASMDPVWSTAYGTRDAAALIWDTLYGLDAGLKPRRQMVESEEPSADRLTWIFRLRPGLKFHNGEPVRAADAVASINRWAARDRTARMIKDREEELSVVDDRTFRWVLTRPFPKMLLALGKTGPPCCFIMPASIAATDPYQEINEYIGSGPMRFVAGEWAPGTRAAFERFSDYVPRQEPASWLAGGRPMLVDRIEWNAASDPASAAAALESGEVDWWERVPVDVVSKLRGSARTSVEIRDPLGDVGFLCMNQLARPFDDLNARRALLAILSQQDYMRAGTGNDDALWRPMPAVFPPGTPLYNEEGGEILKGSRRLDEAKQLLVESGYSGQPVNCLIVQDEPVLRAWGQVTLGLLKRLDMNVMPAAIDRAGLAARRDQGGWNLCHAVAAGADCVYPTNELLRAGGEVAANGWADLPDEDADVYFWFDTSTADGERTAARDLNKAALENVVCAPIGFFLSHHAWRKELSGIVQGPLPFFWGVSKGE